MRAPAHFVILVAIHDFETRRYIARTLEEAGAQVVVAMNAEEAFRRLRHFTIDAVVIDGEEASRPIAKRLRICNVPCAVYAQTPADWDATCAATPVTLISPLRSLIDETVSW